MARCGNKLASFPGLPTDTVQFVQVIKNWTVGRPGNEASKKSLAYFHTQETSYNTWPLSGVLNPDVHIQSATLSHFYVYD